VSDEATARQAVSARPRIRNASAHFKLVAREGYTVAAPRYSLAPKHRYPTPTRQLMQALAYLQANAERLQPRMPRG